MKDLRVTETDNESKFEGVYSKLSLKSGFQRQSFTKKGLQTQSFTK